MKTCFNSVNQNSPFIKYDAQMDILSATNELSARDLFLYLHKMKKEYKPVLYSLGKTIRLTLRIIKQEAIK